jgi:transposase-like protein
MMPHEPIDTRVSPTPISRRDHQPLRVVVLSLLPELLSYRDVEEIMAERGVVVTYEVMRRRFTKWREVINPSFASE